MDALKQIFQRKAIRRSALIPYGFVQDRDAFVYQKVLPGSGLLLSMTVSEQGAISAEITDPATGEPYTLHRADGAAGRFVGGVRREYEEILSDIAAHCCEADIFRSDLARRLIAYVRRTYGDEPEYLWKKFPGNAVWRRSDNEKWYGALLTVSRKKLGLSSDEVAEIIDLRAEPEELPALLEQEHYYPGWHMNKKHWYTVILDGSVPFEALCRRVDDSYRLAGGK